MNGAAETEGGSPARWQMWIDTGGTFTDCMATDPQGVVHRVKVLSSSSLRGRMVRRTGPRTLQVSQVWEGDPDLIVGLRLRPVSGGDGSRPLPRVVRFDRNRGELVLDGECPAGLEDGSGFELLSDEPAPILAARMATGTPVGASLPPMRMRLATTRGTNALLERRGAEVALFVTQGFADLLTIGDQQRPELFALDIVKPAPLHTHVVEVRERLAADGSVLSAVDEPQLARQAARLVDAGIRVAAVALMHAYRNPAHEQLVRGILLQAGFQHVSCSAALSPLIRILPRAQTAVVNAYLSPVIDAFLHDVFRGMESGGAGQSSLHVMTSAGGLVPANRYVASESLLSGPAGGVMGAAAVARRSGFRRIISFDMGGTSTDVARFDGAMEYRFEQCIDGIRLMMPALAIETVAAGGGSICRFQDGEFRVGPESAGAHPGPACYGAGGPLTITDVNLLLGRIRPEQFEIPIDAQAAVSALGDSRNAPGFLAIANERMAAAIESVSVRQGCDPAEYALVAFGGAAGQHACAVADWLGMDTVLMPADASLLSAVGLGEAVIERVGQEQVLQALHACWPDLPARLDKLATHSMQEIRNQGGASGAIGVRRVILNLRLHGQESSLAIEVDPPAQSTDAGSAIEVPSIDELTLRFLSASKRLLGYEPRVSTAKPIEVESVRVIVSQLAPPETPALPIVTVCRVEADRTARAWFGDRWLEVGVHEREALAAGSEIIGPAMIGGLRSTCILDENWRGVVDQWGTLVATRLVPRRGVAKMRQDKPFELDLFSNRLSAIAQDMGHVLQRTAVSTNVKDRLDFSCAVLNAAGELVVNAPHIPVHLGAMGVCVRETARILDMRPGDVVISNHPAFGGSHLPDVTVITPVFDEANQRIGYVASRAHHAEIGGTRPGSMPPTARSLAEEGVVISPRFLVRGGVSGFDSIEALLLSGPFPSRNVGDNLADLRAAVAANQRGVAALRSLATEHGRDQFAAHMGSIMDRAERSMREALRRRGDGTYAAVERLDDGSPIQVSVRITDGSASISFGGSAGTHPGNLNATPAIVRSAVMYVMRLLVGRSLPLNEGMMRAVDIELPPGLLNPPFTDDPSTSPAVVAGNTETSQRIVDTLLKSLGLAACSQGTMNNVLFGNDRFGYYETVCGGCGATRDRNGADAVHSHMTNTRITDPEILEHRYPVRLERFAVCSGSGGAGTCSGGDGVVRELQFLEPMSLSVVSQHRVEAPFGLEGGQPGKRGSQRLIRASGEVMEMSSIDGREVEAGDRLILETPGGGGFGPA